MTGSATRENVMTALLALITGAYAWTTPPSRRLKLWADVPPSTRPAAFLFEGGDERYEWKETNVNPMRTLAVDLFVYIDATDVTQPGASQLNAIADALDAALKPSGSDIVLGRNTLGGTCWQCRIDGSIKKTPGDLDGDGLLWAPIRIIFP
jgi:hypothetical protein